MKFRNSFDVPLAPDEAWKVLLDIPRIAPCMPGAELTGVIDATTYEGRVAVRLGPVALAFTGKVKFEDVDDTQHTARVKARGADTKGRGGADATIAFALEPIAAGSKVTIDTDLALSGNISQYGRGAGMIQDLAGELTNRFAISLRAQLQSDGADADGGATDHPRRTPPLAVLPLLLTACWRALLRHCGLRTSG